MPEELSHTLELNHQRETTYTVNDISRMTDQDIATKAPESDAHETVTSPASAAEQSPFPGDTPAQTGPTMGVGAYSLFRALDA